CFLNKLASEGVGMDVYTKAEMILHSDGTGSNHFELYDDAGCTNMLADGIVDILSYEKIKVGQTQVLKMRQDDGHSVMDIWIPYKIVGTGIYFDLDFTDGESGPYLSEPGVSEIADFEADPSGQGVSALKH